MYDLFLASGLELHDNGKATDPLDKGEQAVAQVTTDDGIAFPVTDHDAQVDLLRAFTDMTLSSQNTPGILGSVAFATELAHDSRVLDHVPATGLVTPQPPIDGFRADFQQMKALEDAADLLRAELATNEAEDLCALSIRIMRATATSAPPGNSVAVGLLGSVLLSVSRQVSAQLTTDGAGVLPICRAISACEHLATLKALMVYRSSWVSW